MRPLPPKAPPATLRTMLRGGFEHTPRALGLVWRASKGGTVTTAVLTILGAIFPLGIAWVGKRIVDSVVAKDMDATLHWVACELGLVVLVAATSQGSSLVRQVTGARLGLDINLAILDKASRLELSDFEDPEFYDQLSRARREASSRPLAVVTRSFQVIQSTLSLFGYMALLVQFSGVIVIALLLAAIPATVAEMKYSRKAFRQRNWRSPDARRLVYLEYVLANDEHAKEVKLFGLGPLFLQRYRALGEAFYKDDTALAVRAAAWAYVLSLLATATFYACYANMAYSAARGAITLGAMTLGMVSFRQGQQSFQALLGAFSGMYEDNLYMSNLFSFFDNAGARGKREEARAKEREAAKLLPPVEEKKERGIRFEGVGFRYPGREEWALHNVSIFIPQGQSLALVGQNGAGKTTFIKLLTRLYAPTEGRIFLDGIDLRAWDEEALLKRVAVVFQDFVEYQLSAKENVGLGSVAQMDDLDQVKRAVERGGADGVLSSLKQGLDTHLGRWFDREGVELSGGQWQKIALARAFMREGADVLILDEPTASLDAEAEHAVFERFRELTRGKTSILISHRFPTVRMADRILVIEKGEVVEEGTHAELVKKDGRYAHLFALQARGYL